MNNTLNRYLNRAFVWFCVENARNISYFENTLVGEEVGNVTESSDTYY